MRPARTASTEVFTSGNDFEALTAQYLPDYYNCSNDNAVVDDRSGKKGPEAESVTVGTVDGRTYAFVALERTGGVMVYDVTEPASAQYVNYINTRDFASIVEGSEEYEDGELDKWVTGGDVAPEGLLFLDACRQPHRRGPAAGRLRGVRHSGRLSGGRSGPVRPALHRCGGPGRPGGALCL